MLHENRVVRGKLNMFVRLCMLVLFVFVLPVGCALTSHFTNSDRSEDWRTARQDSTGIAPVASETDEAVIQVYAARAFKWRGAFGVHTWIAAKPQGADEYTRLEVIGFSVARGGDAVRVRPGIPDGYWYGSYPTLLRDIRGGDEIDELIDRLYVAAKTYPYNDEYRIWPGPNSNTFIAYLAREVPELRLNLPPNAIGKDYLPNGRLVATAPSGTGFQLSLGGLLGIMVAQEEGIEFNFLALNAGVDFWPLALNLPGLGRLGMPVEAPLVIP